MVKEKLADMYIANTDDSGYICLEIVYLFKANRILH